MDQSFLQNYFQNFENDSQLCFINFQHMVLIPLNFTGPMKRGGASLACPSRLLGVVADPG